MPAMFRRGRGEPGAAPAKSPEETVVFDDTEAEAPVYPITVPALSVVKKVYSAVESAPVVGHFVHLGHAIADSTVTRLAGIEGGCAELDARLTQFAPIVDAEIIAPQVAKYRPQVVEALTTTQELAQPYWEKAKPHVEKVIIAGEPIVTAAWEVAGPLLASVRDRVVPALEEAELALDAEAAKLCDNVDVEKVAEAVESAVESRQHGAALRAM